jgi:cobyric acid synthase
MDRATAKALRNKLNEVFEQHGIDGYSIHVGNASYDDAQVTFKVEVREDGAKKNATSKHSPELMGWIPARLQTSRVNLSRWLATRHAPERTRGSCKT